jgi:hypothetical protein
MNFSLYVNQKIFEKNLTKCSPPEPKSWLRA